MLQSEGSKDTERAKGWRQTTLGKISEINTATYSPKENWPFINYLDTGSITENSMSDLQHLVMGEHKIPSRARRKVRPGDIVYSTVRPNQRHYGVIEETPENFLASTGFAVIHGIEALASSRFIYYFLTQDLVVDHLHGVAETTTSAYPSIKPADLEALSILLPPLSEQKAIAHVLGTLDDKIELNRQMNRTLEGMARAIFQDWFVDFGPTRAKIEGQEPYLPPELWDLFPDELVNSEMGKIPEGWHASELGKVASFPVRTVKPHELPRETAYIGLDHMPRKSIALDEWEGAGKVTSNKLSFKRGEFLFGKLRPYFHKVGLAPTDGICSTDIVVASPKKAIWSSFVLMCISTDEFVSYTDKTSNGTKMPRTNWKTMSQYEVCLPPDSLAQVFQCTAQDLLNRIATNIHESRVLKKQRDTLLPRMFSGKGFGEEEETSHAL